MFTIKFVLVIVNLLIVKEQFRLYRRIKRAQKYNDLRFAKKIGIEMICNTIVIIVLTLLIIFL